ncbi:MAG: flagellar basal body-associated FliL family protein [Sulfitobacter sp.]|nr:flagellar basal body-associated FliL family protein [Sulfitobacter sp.]
MALKPKAKTSKEDAPAVEGAEEKPRGSRKMLLAAALLCVLSLGGGFFLARMAYLQDAETYEPEYKDAEAEAEDGHGEEGAHAETEEKKEDGHGDAEAKDGEHVEVVDTGMLEFGDILTNIQGFDAQGTPTRAFLKINLVVAYRTDEGAGDLMKEREAFMRDLFNSYLRGISESDVRGMAGVLYVKAELLKRARAATGNDLPQEILIHDLIVQ